MWALHVAAVAGVDYESARMALRKPILKEFKSFLNTRGAKEAYLQDTTAENGSISVSAAENGSLTLIGFISRACMFVCFCCLFLLFVCFKVVCFLFLFFYFRFYFMLFFLHSHTSDFEGFAQATATSTGKSIWVLVFRICCVLFISSHICRCGFRKQVQASSRYIIS